MQVSASRVTCQIDCFCSEELPDRKNQQVLLHNRRAVNARRIVLPTRIDV